MKILIASDLHLEFHDQGWRNGLFDLTPPDRIILPLDPRLQGDSDADVLVLAGDIIKLHDRRPLLEMAYWADGHEISPAAEAELKKQAAATSMRAWLKDFADNQFQRPVIYVLGNHEFYGSEIQAARKEARDFFAGSNVILLDNASMEIDGVRFIGSTLWTDYRASGNQMRALAEANRRINDHRRIRLASNLRGGHFMSSDALAEHQVARAFLEDALERPFAGKTVVVTHHAPSVRHGKHPAYEVDDISAAFSSDLEHLFPSVDLWIWGHTHASVDCQVGRTRLVSNQAGYPQEQVPGGFDPVKMVEVTDP